MTSYFDGPAQQSASRDKLAGLSELHQASGRGDLSKVQELLESSDIAIDARGKIDWVTPLHCAGRNGHALVCECLICRGADVNLRCRSGDTPLHGACANGHLMVVRALIAAGADLNAEGQSSRTAMHWACKFVAPAQAPDSAQELVQTLADAGAEIDQQDNAGYTPLHLAAQRGNTAVCALLLRIGADPGMLAAQSLTVLHSAAGQGRVQTCLLLVAKGADIHACNHWQQSPADLALCWGNEALADHLRCPLPPVLLGAGPDDQPTYIWSDSTKQEIQRCVQKLDSEWDRHMDNFAQCAHVGLTLVQQRGSSLPALLQPLAMKIIEFVFEPMTEDWLHWCTSNERCQAWGHFAMQPCGSGRTAMLLRRVALQAARATTQVRREIARAVRGWECQLLHKYLGFLESAEPHRCE